MSPVLPLDKPNDIFFGLGETTGVPVKINLDGSAINSVVFIGEKGCGKTFAIQSIVRRLYQANTSATMFVIDPFDEFGGVAADCNLVNVPVFNIVPEIDEHSRVVLKDWRPDDNPERAKLLFSALNNTMTKIGDMLRNRPKILVLNDAHFILRTEEGKRNLDMIVRLCRRHNIVLLASVRSFHDLGTELAFKFAMRVFMSPMEKQKDIEKIGFDASNAERIVKSNRGSGVVTTYDHQIYTQFK